MIDSHCDRCGAIAKSRFILEEGDLVFCGHHARSYEDSLVEQGATLDFEYSADRKDLIDA